MPLARIIIPRGEVLAARGGKKTAAAGGKKGGKKGDTPGKKTPKRGGKEEAKEEEEEGETVRMRVRVFVYFSRLIFELIACEHIRDVLQGLTPAR
jgi:hypothetical protein